MNAHLVLLPRPQTIALLGGTVALADHRLIALAVPKPANLRFTALRLQDALKRYAARNWEIVGGEHVPTEQIGLRIVLGDGGRHPQGYRLTVAVDRINLEAHDEAGAFYGMLTLAQLLQQYGASLPVVVIEDWPDFPTRGVMLDISRDKVPTMETLYGLVDRLASWKINQFQLYTEHTFAYRQHPAVWAKASPVTAEQILALDAYCRERYIDLVPNQNSFGHMHRWFEHSPYLSMAEAPDGCETPWGYRLDYPFSLSPVDPNCLPFLDGLYDELLPNFTSQYFNVGCDETIDLGQGRSQALCDEKGQGRVYLDFLLKIYERVKARGRTMQYWGDIIGNYPELVAELPKDAVALEWGYEDIHPFDEKSAAFAASGIPFYVCPGTSSWTSIGGRTTNMLANIDCAVSNALKHGAIGVLNTDWGDLGHWQTYPVSYAGFAYGAALSWGYQANAHLDLPAALDAFAFEDKAGVIGQLACDLGNAYRQPGVHVSNGSVLFWAYHLPLNALSAPVTGMAAGIRALIESDRELPDNLRRTLAYIDQVMSPLDQAQMTRPDAALLADEFRLTADMLRHGAQRLLLILGDSSISKAQLQTDLLAIEERYRAIWLARNRPGGLDDSVGRIIAARAAYA